MECRYQDRHCRYGTQRTDGSGDGGAVGIGAGIAERLATEGMQVVIADLDDRQGPVLAERIGGSFVRTDLADRAGVRAAVDAAGPVGVLVNNAGGTEEPHFPEADLARWDRALDLNLRAVMLATQLVLAPTSPPRRWNSWPTTPWPGGSCCAAAAASHRGSFRSPTGRS